jgi:predicted O-methyltransferase YrrM
MHRVFAYLAVAGITLAVTRVGSVAAQQGKGTPPAASPSPEKEFLPKDDAETKILAVLDDLDKNHRAGHMNVPVEDGRLLRLLTESLGARHVVEIGTSNGYSGIWFCLALRQTGGKLTTHEINAPRAAEARANFQRAGVDHLVTLVEGDAHETVTRLKGPIDLLFLDADPRGYLDYMEKIGRLVRPGGLIVTHNVHRPAPDPAWIKRLTTSPDLNTIFLNMHAAGIAVSLKRK